jgi:hypothetical protein
MNKSEIQQLLKENHVRFLNNVTTLSDTDFLFSSNGKWTAGQQLEHMVKSVRPVVLAFRLPAFLLKVIFGKANRPSKDYNALVEKYKQKLAAGGKASAPFIPNPVAVADKEKLSKRLSSLIETLVKQVDSYSEEKLDQLILPHPLLGKLTFREMLFFTIYHVEHHEKHTLQNLEKRS